jgi:hypothetical protein
VTFAASSLQHPQPLVAPKPLDILVIHLQALTAGIVIRRSETATRPILGVLT